MDYGMKYGISMYTISQCVPASFVPFHSVRPQTSEVPVLHISYVQCMSVEDQ